MSLIPASLAVLIVLSMVACGGSAPPKDRSASDPTASGPSTSNLSVELAQDDGRDHIPSGAPHAPYSTVPATSGPHWSTVPSEAAPLGAPVRWGIYDQVIPDEALVHNLEHGGIGLHYDCPDGCPGVVAALRAIVPSNPSQFVVSPYPGMRSKIAVTAWRRVMYMDEVDAQKIREFVTEYQDRAPESVEGNLF